MTSDLIVDGSDINLSDFYVSWLNKIINGRTIEGRRFSARLVAIDGDVLIFRNSKGAIFRHAARDLAYVSPKEAI